MGAADEVKDLALVGGELHVHNSCRRVVCGVLDSLDGGAVQGIPELHPVVGLAQHKTLVLPLICLLEIHVADFVGFLARC